MRVWWIASPQKGMQALTRARQRGCYFLPSPSRFAAISPEVRYGSSPNFQYPLSHQFDTSRQKENSLGLIRRP